MAGTRRTLWNAAQAVYLLLLTALFVACVVNISAQMERKQFFFSREDATHFHIIDFVNCYSAGHLGAMKGVDIYDAGVQLESFNRVIAPERLDQAFYLQYPPYFFLLTRPLAWGTIEQSFVWWNVLSSIVGFASLALIIRRSRGWSVFAILLAAWATMCSLPGCQTIRMGTPGGWLMVGFFIGFFHLMRTKHDLAAGLILALTTYKPQYSVFLAVPALAQKRWKLIAAAAGFEALLFAWTGLALGWDKVINWPNTVLHAEKTADVIGVHPENMVSMRGLYSGLLPTDVALGLSIATMAFGLALAFYLITRPQNRGRDCWNFAIVIMLSIITSPHTHLPDVIFLIVPALLTMRGINLADWRNWKPLPDRLWTLGWIAYPGLTWLAMVALQRVNTMLPFVALNLLNICLFIIALRLQDSCAPAAENDHTSQPA